jgi:hypothetical protein
MLWRERLPALPAPLDRRPSARGGARRAWHTPHNMSSGGAARRLPTQPRPMAILGSETLLADRRCPDPVAVAVRLGRGREHDFVRAELTAAAAGVPVTRPSMSLALFPAAWQPNPGRRSTYRRGKSVQTTGTTSAGVGFQSRGRASTLRRSVTKLADRKMLHYPKMLTPSAL